MKSNNDINFTSSRTLIGSLIGCIIGFFLMLFKHAILGFFIFFIAAVITIISFTSLSVLTSPNGKRLENGFKSGCLTSFIAFVLLIVGLTVGMPDTPSPSMSDSAVPPETTSQINTVDSAESLESTGDTNVPLDVESSEESIIESEVESDIASKAESSEVESSEVESSEVESSEPATPSVTVELPAPATSFHFVMNEDTKKFHVDTCHDVEKIAPENFNEAYITDEKLSDAVQRMIDMGYSPCGHCLR